MRKSMVLGLSMLVTLLWASLALAAEPAAARLPLRPAWAPFSAMR